MNETDGNSDMADAARERVHRRLRGLREARGERRESVQEPNATLTHLDCFAGLGAWTIACHAEGIRTIGFIEKDKRCQNFLSKAWPRIPIHGDINELDGRSFRGVGILTAGVPCQSASRAGKQLGKSDDRWLWPATIRLVSEARPGVCIFENPPGIGDVGLDGILDEVASLGYQIAPIFDIPACAVDSPQVRHRYYIVAFREGERPENGQWKDRPEHRGPILQGGLEQSGAFEQKGDAGNAKQECGQRWPVKRCEAGTHSRKS